MTTFEFAHFEDVPKALGALVALLFLEVLEIRRDMVKERFVFILQQSVREASATRIKRRTP